VLNGRRHVQHLRAQRFHALHDGPGVLFLLPKQPVVGLLTREPASGARHRLVAPGWLGGLGLGLTGLARELVEVSHAALGRAGPAHHVGKDISLLGRAVVVNGEQPL
jgi:hypothetical protein